MYTPSGSKLTTFEVDGTTIDRSDPLLASTMWILPVTGPAAPAGLKLNA